MSRRHKKYKPNPCKHNGGFKNFTKLPDGAAVRTCKLCGTRIVDSANLNVTKLEPVGFTAKKV